MGFLLYYIFGVTGKKSNSYTGRAWLIGTRLIRSST